MSLEFVPEKVDFDHKQGKFSQLHDFIFRAAHRINALWTGDTQQVTTAAGGTVTVTFKRKYSSEPHVQCTVVKENPIAHYAGVRSFTVTANKYVSCVVEAIPNAAVTVNVMVVEV